MVQSTIHPLFPKFQPMLSGKYDDTNDMVHLKHFPYIASPKVDGFRCIIDQAGVARTRTLKRVPNKFVQSRIEYLTRFEPKLKYLDGELVIGGASELTKPDSFSRTSSAVTSHGGEPSITFWVFDSFTSPFQNYQQRFLSRYTELSDLFSELDNHFDGDQHHKVKFQLLPYCKANSLSELESVEELYVAQGYEGMCFRNPHKPYKCGRSATTTTQEHLIKLTRWETAEGEITDVEELMHNDNELTTDERGYAKRSTASGGKTPANTLGAFIVTVLNGQFAGQELRVGTGKGLTHDLRQRLWESRDVLKGKVITFKYRPHGSKDKNRFPIYKGFRSREDFNGTS